MVTPYSIIVIAVGCDHNIKPTTVLKIRPENQTYFFIFLANVTEAFRNNNNTVIGIKFVTESISASYIKNASYSRQINFELYKLVTLVEN